MNELHRLHTSAGRLIDREGINRPVVNTNALTYMFTRYIFIESLSYLNHIIIKTKIPPPLFRCVYVTDLNLVWLPCLGSLVVLLLYVDFCVHKSYSRNTSYTLTVYYKILYKHMQTVPGHTMKICFYG